MLKVSPPANQIMSLRELASDGRSHVIEWRGRRDLVTVTKESRKSIGGVFTTSMNLYRLGAQTWATPHQFDTHVRVYFVVELDQEIEEV